MSSPGSISLVVDPGRLLTASGPVLTAAAALGAGVAAADGALLAVADTLFRQLTGAAVGACRAAGTESLFAGARMAHDFGAALRQAGSVYCDADAHAVLTAAGALR